MVFSTPASTSAFKVAFTVPATALLSPPLECASSKDLYTQLGKLWGAGHRAVQSLDGSDRHVPATDSSLKDDVAGEVETILDGAGCPGGAPIEELLVRLGYKMFSAGDGDGDGDDLLPTREAPHRAEGLDARRGAVHLVHL